MKVPKNKQTIFLSTNIRRFTKPAHTVQLNRQLQQQESIASTFQRLSASRFEAHGSPLAETHAPIPFPQKPPAESGRPSHPVLRIASSQGSLSLHTNRIDPHNRRPPNTAGKPARCFGPEDFTAKNKTYWQAHFPHTSVCSYAYASSAIMQQLFLSAHNNSIARSNITVNKVQI